MKITVIYSSANSDGLTASAKDRVVAGLKEKGAEILEIWLNQADIRMCQACGNGWGTCRSDGTCVIQDGFADVYAAVQEADGVVFVTAVYWHDMTECLKAFIDRMRRCDRHHNHTLDGKKVMITACAGGSGNGVTRCLEVMEYALDKMNMKTVERLPVTRFSREYMLPALEEAGKRFAEEFE